MQISPKLFIISSFKLTNVVSGMKLRYECCNFKVKHPEGPQFVNSKHSPKDHESIIMTTGYWDMGSKLSPQSFGFYCSQVTNKKMKELN